MRTIIIVTLILVVLAVAGTVGAFSVADYADAQVRRIVAGVETVTDWDCQYRIIDRPGLFAVGIYCNK